ncbi:MAG: signal recognition particle-docking protein FtsY [Myxococcales bacterium]|nr:signal recognition particle-docking protein FtsY [Myxococcales bacterium]MCB9520584.1 signal recognition particle-docking protein FtsY [Myxococcales bacterium]MCB9531507.1 signal recognition particle-docking protein FtsY [Myxococcales bacterium]
MNDITPVGLMADASSATALLGLGLGPVIIAVVAVIVLAVVAALRGRGRLAAPAPPPSLQGAAAPKPIERQTVDAPVEITEGMSLREIKEARSARLNRGADAEALAAEKERRRGRPVAAPNTSDLAATPGSEEPLGGEAPSLAADPTEVASTEAAAPADRAAPAAGEGGEPLAFDEEGWGDALVPRQTPPETEELAKGAAAERTASTEAPAGLRAEPMDAPPATPPQPDQAADPAAAAADAAVSKSSSAAPTPVPAAPAVAAPAPIEEPAPALAASLEKTRGGFVARIGSIFASKPRLDAAVLEELEEVLFTADIGVKTSTRLLAAVEERFSTGEVSDPRQVWGALRAETAAILRRNPGKLEVEAGSGPRVLLMVGVNGAGKTTTIGKLASQFTRRGLRVLVVAGDTFRAAAVDQLAEWASRVGVALHSGKEGSDPSGVVFEGLRRAVDEKFDLVLCDTAGRLQTKAPLMDELRKIARVAGKAVDGAPHETVLVIDSNTGQNAIQQAKMFGEAVPLTGLILTKLDGTAKGGVVIGISEELQVPIYAIGIGEAVEDLRPFDADEFVDALF